MYRPRIGERVMIDVLPTGESYPAHVRVVSDDPALVVALVGQNPEPMPVGAPVRITFVRKDGLYEEEGTITDLAVGEEGALTISLSGEVSRTQRRDFVRRDATLNAEVQVRGSRTRCVTKDISGGGVSLLFSELPPLREGEEFVIALNVPDGRLPIRAQCRTKYVREVLRGSRWMVGSRFATIADDDRQRIVRFVFRLELAQKRR